jgi:glucose-1-phosphate adenylyltransferase
MAEKDTLSIVLAGGRGSRLYPMTKTRAKPAVSFGGIYRVVDFTLSNLYNSGIRKIYVLTQFEPRSLHRHIKYGWYPKFGVGSNEYLMVLPTRETTSGGWAQGTAESVFHNIDYLRDDNSAIVNVFGADHVYLMNVSQMNDFHAKKNADLTISVIPVRRELAAKNFGVIEADRTGMIKGFEEKPENPKPMPGNKEHCLVSMGSYTFEKEGLLEALNKDIRKEFSEDPETVREDPEHFSKHDFGFDIIPAFMREGKRVFAYNFTENSVPGMRENERGYWRDIGTIEQFYEANMEVRNSKPPINLSNPEWEVLTYLSSPRVVKFEGKGCALESIVANGCVIIDSNVEKSVLSYNTIINQNSKIQDSILLGNNEIGKNVVIKGAIIEKGIVIPDKETVGVDREKDEKRGFYEYSKKIPIVPRDYKF